jgi:hypothetical protein
MRGIADYQPIAIKELKLISSPCNETSEKEHWVPISQNLVPNLLVHVDYSKVIS